MTYHFTARGATKDDLMSNVEKKLDEVVAAHPMHKADVGYVRDSVRNFVSVLESSADEHDFHVSVSGSLGWVGDPDKEHMITGASLNVLANLVKAEAKAGSAEPAVVDQPSAETPQEPLPATATEAPATTDPNVPPPASEPPAQDPPAAQ